MTNEAIIDIFNSKSTLMKNQETNDKNKNVKNILF